MPRSTAEVQYHSAVLTVRQGHCPISGPAAVVAGKLLFSAFTIGAYGFHRDELYLQECGKHLAWGFLDHGPLVPALASLALHGFGPSPAAARVFSAAASAATVWAAARGARALGGAPLAQTLAAVLVAISPLFVYSGGVFGTNAFDQLFWTLAGLCAVRAAGGEARWVPWLGLCAGLGILAKPTMIVGAVCILAALSASAARTQLRGAGPWLAVAVAAVLTSPLLLWEQTNGWPGIAFLAANRASVLGEPGRLMVVVDQLRLLGALSCVAAAAGVASAFRRGGDVRMRVAALPFAFALVAVTALGGKPYYASSAAPLAIAAGAVVLADYVRMVPRLSSAVLAVTAAAQCVGALPLVPSSSLVARLHPDLVQFADWRALVSGIARLHSTAGLDAEAPVLTDSYGTAAALERFGGPPVLSGANAFAAWAWEHRTAEPDAVLAIGYPPALLRRFFRDVRPAGSIVSAAGSNNGFDFPRDAWLCAGRTRSLRDGWTAFAHFD